MAGLRVAEACSATAGESAVSAGKLLCFVDNLGRSPYETDMNDLDG